MQIEVRRINITYKVGYGEYINSLITILIVVQQLPLCACLLVICLFTMLPLAETALVLAHYALSPILPLLALSVFACRPEALTWLSQLVPIGLETQVAALKWLWGIALVRAMNRALNWWALGNWRVAKSRWQWQNEVGVVTGGCSGIGLAIAQALASRGVKVAVLDIQDPPQHDDFDNLVFFKCDITSANQVGRVAKRICADMGHPSILVNNAGIAGQRSILQTSGSELRKVFEVNVFAHWTTIKEFLPSMVKQNKGHVITVASLASFVSTANTADYSASKAALLAFHECLTSEIKHIFRAPGVMTTIVHPSYTKTPLNEYVADAIEKKHGKMLAPGHVASRVVEQIMTGRGAQLIIPSHFSWVSAVKGFPNWMQECIRDRLSA